MKMSTIGSFHSGRGLGYEDNKISTYIIIYTYIFKYTLIKVICAKQDKGNQECQGYKQNITEKVTFEQRPKEMKLGTLQVWEVCSRKIEHLVQALKKECVWDVQRNHKDTSVTEEE